MRRGLAVLLLATACAKAPEPAGKLCGSIAVLGRPLPFGLAALSPDATAWPGDDALGRGVPQPGPERSFVRVEDGAFCFDRLPPGNYRLFVLPLGLQYKEFVLGLAGGAPLLASRLSVDAAGAAAVFGPAGERLAAGPLGLEALPAHPERRTALLRLRLRAPKGAAGKRDAVFLLARVRTGPRNEPIPPWSYHQLPYSIHPAWADFSGGESVVELPVEPGLVQSVTVWSESWGLASVRAETAPAPADLEATHCTFRGFCRRVAAGAALELGLDLAPAGSIEARFANADGTPFRQRLHLDVAAGDWSGRAIASLGVAGLAHHDAEWYAADNTGSVRVHGVAEGTRVLVPRGEGDAFTSAIEPEDRLVRVRPGAATPLDVRLDKTAPVGVAGKLPAASRGDGDRRTLAVIGVREGGAPTPLTSYPFYDPGIFFALSEKDGQWRADASHNHSTPHVFPAPGRYEVYLVEANYPAPLEPFGRHRPQARILAGPVPVDIAPGRAVAIELPPPSPKGGASLEVRVRAQDVPDAVVGKAETLAGLMRAASPELRVYSEQGALLGIAYAGLDAAELAALQASLDGHGTGRLPVRSPAVLRLDGLPAGPARASVITPGGAKYDRTVALAEGVTTVLDAVIDAR